MRHCALIRVLRWPLRSPRSDSSRFPGTAVRLLRLLTVKLRELATPQERLYRVVRGLHPPFSPFLRCMRIPDDVLKGTTEMEGMIRISVGLSVMVREVPIAGVPFQALPQRTEARVVGEGLSVLRLRSHVENQGEIPTAVCCKQTLFVVTVMKIGSDKHAGLPDGQEVHTVPAFPDVSPTLVRPVVVGLSYRLIQLAPIFAFHCRVQRAEFVPELIYGQPKILGEWPDNVLRLQLPFTARSSGAAGIDYLFFDFARPGRSGCRRRWRETCRCRILLRGQ